MMVLHAGRCAAEFFHELFVAQKTLWPAEKEGRLDAFQDLDQPLAHFVDVLRLQRDEVALVDLVGPSALRMRLAISCTLP